MLCEKPGDIAIPLYPKYANSVQVRLKLFTKKVSRTLWPRRFHCSAAHARVGPATQGTAPGVAGNKLRRVRRREQ